MTVTSGYSMFEVLPTLMFIFNGLFMLLGIYALFLFIKLAIRGIQALDIYLDEKRNRRL
ncbi:hypothetical protein KZ483_15515 [Paenibacillus sp. sptzw28]|uniref:hypothetical protein n=1 Tax=Paenibacillus sp. sptzw28 TaxID=715179 RepID=UPI001C6F44FE|nr:hypothetical protein [Paenibacillus sp. sptzw28]QYR24404.1 hypothetical protein KZ483_15515 [Paenibacillus sp. sptzw28]